jgi:chaperonin cofactor prefoldin
MSVSPVEQKFYILLHLPNQGPVPKATVNEILQLPHHRIAMFLGNGHVDAGKKLIGKITNYQLGQALIFDLNQNQNFRLVLGATTSRFPSIQIQLKMTQERLSKALTDNHALKHRIDTLNIHVKTLQRTIDSLKKTVAATTDSFVARLTMSEERLSKALNDNKELTRRIDILKLNIKTLQSSIDSLTKTVATTTDSFVARYMGEIAIARSKNERSANY